MTKQLLTPAEKYKARLERDRLRAQRRREEAAGIGRPAPHVVDRAIVWAMLEAWSLSVAEQTSASASHEEKTQATHTPVAPYSIVALAVANLVSLRKADPAIATEMVGARLLPTPDSVEQARRGEQARHRKETRRLRTESTDSI
jgi:hypothetical protein